MKDHSIKHKILDQVGNNPQVFPPAVLHPLFNGGYLITEIDDRK
jgi:hypothetical protein